MITNQRRRAKDNEKETQRERETKKRRDDKKEREREMPEKGREPKLYLQSNGMAEEEPGNNSVRVPPSPAA